MIEVRCFGAIGDAEFLRGQINALNLLGARPDPFSTFEFFETFLQHEDSSAGGLKLWFLTAFDAGRLVGYMALKLVTHTIFGMSASKLDFLVTHDADGPQLIARPEQALAVSEAFYAYLLGRSNEWTFLEFRQQDATSRLFPPPSGTRLAGYAVRQWPAMNNGTIEIRWASLEAYFRSLSKHFRSNVSRQMRRLLAAGNVEYLSSSDPGVTPGLFEMYQDIERRSWKAKAGIAIGRHPRWPDYFGGLLTERQPMHVFMHILLLDGVPVAGLITGAFGQGLYALHIAFDDGHRNLGLGSAALLMGMRQAIEGRFAFFNLLSGFAHFKVRWLATMSPSRNAQIYRIGTPFFWRRVSGDLVRRVHLAPRPGPMLQFNPARRALGGVADSTEHVVAPRRLLLAGEREVIARVIATVIARVGRNHGEHLSGRELATLMPFAAQRGSAC